jgi:thiosulfate/3-mercaptopyruvate sulfurtransferase
VRVVASAPERREQVEATGAECFVGRPDRLATLRGSLEHVTIACWLLADASGDPQLVRALHGPRLEQFLCSAIDSTVRGFVYEIGGKVVAPDTLAEGWRIVLETATRNSIPAALLTADPLDCDAWIAQARAVVNKLLEGRHPVAKERYADAYTPKSRSAFDCEASIRRTAELSEYAKDVLVEPDWLQEHLNDDDLRIVEVDENPRLYAEAHIPGAVGFDWKEDLQDLVKRDFLGPEDFGALFSRNGISSDHTIVLYGDRNNWFAAYTYWYLKYYGHEKVLLLNGPREKWISDGRPATTEAPGHTPAAFLAKAGDETIRARREEVLAAIGDSTNLVDVRSPAEFAGEIISPSGYEQEGAQRAGHIPGAASIPWAQAVNEDGTFKSAEQLRELYGSKGVLDGKDVIAYCRIGERSAHTWFVLHELLGMQDVKNYDGSWTEWGSLVGVPVATGA